MKINSEKTKTETTFKLELTEKEMIAITALIGCKTTGQTFWGIYREMQKELTKNNLLSSLKEKEATKEYKDTEELAVI